MTVTALDIANRHLDFVQQPGAKGLRLSPAADAQVQPTLDLLLIAAALCNDAVLQRDSGQSDQYHTVGDPTEGALILAAAHAGIIKDDLDRTFPRVAELPFDSERKRMTTVHRMPRSRHEVQQSLAAVWERRIEVNEMPEFVAATKGAIDGLLRVSSGVWSDGQTVPLDEGWQQRVMEAHDSLAGSGMRILGVGVRALDHIPDIAEMADLERDLLLIGLIGMMDPPRPEVRGAVQMCKAAGIRPVMITGDHPLTAQHIAREVGIATNGDFVIGQDLERMSADELRRAVAATTVFARVSPEHKIRLVQAYRANGAVVAMTGDGVNDAPALKQADIGVAMGITGTDVAKEAAKMVLLDDNFATIVAAVREGRVVYDNIRRFIKYLLTCNASEVAVMLIGPVFGLPLPLQALQILWMNLVTDGLPALALGIEPAEKDVMERPPQAATESIFGHGMIPFIVVLGVVMSIASLGVGVFAFRAGDSHWQTLLFTTLVFCQMALALGVRSEHQSLWGLGLRSNPQMVGAVVLTVLLQLAVVYVPFLQTIFRTTAMPFGDLLVTVGAAVAVLVIVEVWKWASRR
jgi:Ca2+-transporting ATPase